jgi:ATP-binding cassette subfamily B protein
MRGLLTDVIRLQEIKLYGLRDYLMSRWHTHFSTSRGDQLKIEQRAQRLRAIAGAINVVVGFGSQLWLLTRVFARGSGLGSFVFYRQVIDNYSNAGSSLVRNLHTMQENSLYVNDYFDLMAMQPRLVSGDQALKADPERRHRVPNVASDTPAPRTTFCATYRSWLSRGKIWLWAKWRGQVYSRNCSAFYDPLLVRSHRRPGSTRVDLASWYRRIGALFQDFNRYRSLNAGDNITMGDPGRRQSKRRREMAAHRAGADAFINNFPKAYEQILNRSFENGIEPSGGQWQRIALARAFYRDAAVLILDEPTSAIDAAGEFEIFEQIAITQQHKTTLIISHRFSTVRNAHRISCSRVAHYRAGATTS